MKKVFQKLMLKFFSALLLVLVSYDSLHAHPIIITHGFRGKNASWYQPGGDFYEAVKTHADKQGHPVHSFGWEQPFGGASFLEQHRAAFELALFIWNLHEEVILIAHSYGGLVSYQASQFLGIFQRDPLAQEKIRLFFSLTKPTLKNLFGSKKEHALLMQQHKDFENTTHPEQHINGTKQTHSYIKRLYNASHRVYETIISSSKHYYDLIKEKFFRKPQISQKKTILYPIKFLFTLGTPHRPNDPEPNMKVIGHLYNLNSLGDIVANFIAGHGALPETIKQHPNTTNLYVTLQKSGLFQLGHPGHSEIHHPTIGYHLLDIPKLTQNHNNGLLSFHPDRAPSFILNPKTHSFLSLLKKSSQKE